MEIILPKKYLSWSQMSVWQSNPKRYRKEYFENAKKLDTKYLQFGKGIAKSIEDGSYKETIPDLVVYPIPEHKIELEINGVPILSYIDSYDPEEHVFLEYKTGKRPWNAALVHKHDQLLFYATALKWATGKIPRYCDLIWLETEEAVVDPDDFWSQVDRKVALTGKIMTFRREFDSREIERMEDMIVKTAEEISEAYKAFISEI